MQKISSRTVIAILLVIGFFILAIIDENFRPRFTDLAYVGIGGYLGQLYPQQPKKNVNQS